MSTRTTYRILDIKETLNSVQMNYNDANKIAKYLDSIENDNNVHYEETIKVYTPDLSKATILGCSNTMTDKQFEFANTKMNYDDNIDDSALVYSLLQKFIDNLKVDREINKDDSISYTIKSGKGDNKID